MTGIHRPCRRAVSIPKPEPRRARVDRPSSQVTGNKSGDPIEADGHGRQAGRVVRAFGRGAHSERELTAADVLALATREGAAVLGLGERTGSLTPGKDADVVVLRADDLDVSPMLDPAGAVVLQMDRRHIDRVYRAGRAVVRGGAPTEDSRDLVAGLRAAAARLGPVPRSALRAER
ncbi:amidohydrolase family protein [Streptosporangium sp. NPDC002721]|uniref:amidohydrolase family protein n=1 Tax=Streptosporangium sp. NPDC002721 TaxID=3366188 RepID=UPI0036861D5A